MRTLRQRLIEQDLKQGKTIVNKSKESDYVEAVFSISSQKKASYEQGKIAGQETELAKKYTFKIQKDKLGNVIDQIRSIPGVYIQTKTDIKQGEGPKETGKKIQPSFPEVE